MGSSVPSQRLSGADAAFLYLERNEIPLNIACVAIFDGAIPYDHFVANIDSKLDLIPRYRQIAVPPPLNIGLSHLGVRSGFRHPSAHPSRPTGSLRRRCRAGSAGRAVAQLQCWTAASRSGTSTWWKACRTGAGALIRGSITHWPTASPGAALLRIMLDPTPEGSPAIRKPRFHPPQLRSNVEHYSHRRNSPVPCTRARRTYWRRGLAFSTSLDESANRPVQNALQELSRPAARIGSIRRTVPFNRPCRASGRSAGRRCDFERSAGHSSAASGTTR